MRRLNQTPPSIRAVCPDAPPELDAVVQRMMALDVNDRFATPQAVMRAMLPFLKAESGEHAALQPSYFERGADVESAIVLNSSRKSTAC